MHTIYLEITFLQKTLCNFSIDFIVLHHQNMISGEKYLLFLLFLLYILAELQRDQKAESTALSQLTLQADIAPHHLNQAAADRQSQPCPLLFCRIPVGSLLKGTEYPLLILSGNAGSSVAYGKEDFSCFCSFFHCKHDLPSHRSKFHRISQQINQHLADSHSVRPEEFVRQTYMFLKLYFFCNGLRTNQLFYRIQHLLQLKGNRLQLHLSAFYLRHIQNIVD